MVIFDLINNYVERHLSNRDMLNLAKINSDFYTRVKIYRNDNDPPLNDFIITLPIYRNLRILNLRDYIRDKSQLTNIDRLQHIEELDISLTLVFARVKKHVGLHVLSGKHIHHLKKLKKLNAFGNDAILNLSKLPNLLEADLSYVRINRTGFTKNIKLEKLVIRENNKYKVYDLSPLVNMKELTIDDCSIKGISKMQKLRKLTLIRLNPLGDLNFAKDLQELSVFKCNTYHLDIGKLRNIRILDVSCTNFRNFSHLVNLEELNISRNKACMSNSDLQNLTKLKKLVMRSVHCIDDLNCLVNLVELDIQFTSVTQGGIKNLTKVEKLYMNGNTDISDLNHMKSLKVLSIDKVCDNKIDYDSFKYCNQLECVTDCNFNFDTPEEIIAFNKDHLNHYISKRNNKYIFMIGIALQIIGVIGMIFTF